MEKLPKIPDNADKLTEEALIEVACAHILNEVDMVSFLNENGYKTVSSEDKNVSDLSYFVYDKSSNTLSTPFMKPEEVLPLMQDLQQKFEQNKIGYSPFKTKYKDQFLTPKSGEDQKILSDEEVLKHLLQNNFERTDVFQTWQSKLEENISDNGPQKIYRGTAMGHAAHTTFSNGSRAFVYATPNIWSACTYANMDTNSRFGFVEEYQASPNQKYAHDHGLESNQYNEKIDWNNSGEVSYKASETFVEKETNPHLKTYLFDKRTNMMFTIYENGQYVDQFIKAYAKSRRPQKNYRNENLAKRVENIINSQKQKETEKEKEGFLKHFAGLFRKRKKTETVKKQKTQDSHIGRKLCYLRGTIPLSQSARDVQKTSLSAELLAKASEYTK